MNEEYSGVLAVIFHEGKFLYKIEGDVTAGMWLKALDEMRVAVLRAAAVSGKDAVIKRPQFLPGSLGRVS